MNVFVTGASGWIGSAVVRELIAGGHQVIGLARSDAAATALTAVGAQVQRGDLDDLEALQHATAAADGVIQLAFNHEVAFRGGFQAAADAERRAVEAIGEVLAGSDRPLVIAAGLLGLLPGQVATERDAHGPDAAIATADSGPRARWATAEYTLALASRGVRSSIVRLAPTNHGEGDNGFMRTLVDIARAKGASGYIGDGSNRWPAVHRLDSAHLFRLALESAPAGSTLHAVAEEGIPIRTVAEVIGRQLAVPVVAVAPEDAGSHFGWIGSFLAVDSPVSSTLTRELLGWQPAQVGLIADLEQGHYFSHAR